MCDAGLVRDTFWISPLRCVFVLSLFIFPWHTCLLPARKWRNESDCGGMALVMEHNDGAFALLVIAGAASYHLPFIFRSGLHVCSYACYLVFYFCTCSVSTNLWYSLVLKKLSAICFHSTTQHQDLPLYILCTMWQTSSYFFGITVLN